MQIPKILAPLVRVFDAVSDAVGKKSANGRNISPEEWAEIYASARGVVDDAVKRPIAVGDEILVYLGDTQGGEPQWRPGVVVRAWNPTCVNAQVFVDGGNDRQLLEAYHVTPAPICVWWATSITEGTAVGQWQRA